MSVESSRIEGSGATMLAQAIGMASEQSGLDIRLGTVISPLPEIKLEVDGLGYDLERGDFLIIDGLANGLKSGDRVFVVLKENDHYVIGKAVSL